MLVSIGTSENTMQDTAHRRTWFPFMQYMSEEDHALIFIHGSQRKSHTVVTPVTGINRIIYFSSFIRYLGADGELKTKGSPISFWFGPRLPEIPKGCIISAFARPRMKFTNHFRKHRRTKVLVNKAELSCEKAISSLWPLLTSLFDTRHDCRTWILFIQLERSFQSNYYQCQVDSASICWYFAPTSFIDRIFIPIFRNMKILHNDRTVFSYYPSLHHVFYCIEQRHLTSDSTYLEPALSRRTSTQSCSRVAWYYCGFITIWTCFRPRSLCRSYATRLCIFGDEWPFFIEHLS